MFSSRYKCLGAKIRYYRHLKNLEQTELADKIGITRQYLSRLENGTSKPSIDLLFRIAEILEIDVTKILKNDD